MKPRYSHDAPDLMTAVIEETRRRNKDQWRRNSLATDNYANDRTPQPRQPRPTFASNMIFAVLFSIILAFSIILGAVLGLGVVALLFAFLLAPLSTPFFIVGALIGAGVLYLMLHAQKLARQAERRARIRKESRLARLRHA